MLDHIFVKGARENNLKTSTWTFPDKLVVPTACPARASPPWPLTPSTPRASAAMWSPLLRPHVPSQMEKPDVDYTTARPRPAFSIWPRNMRA